MERFEQRVGLGQGLAVLSGDQRGELTGSGLGLAIAKRAVERAGGSIDLESAPARGTTVTIRL